MNQIVYCLTEQHDLRLVVVAGLVSFLSAAVGYDLLARARLERPLLWLSAAAVVTGSGVWATHFIAILAYDPGVPIAFGIVTTALSGIAGMLVSGFGFAVLIHAGKDPTLAPLAGIIIGGGVAVLHYVGMAAFVVPGVIVWSPGLVLWSIGIGCAFGAGSAWLFHRSTTVRQRLVAAFVLTLAVCSHHFTAMGAVEIRAGTMLADLADLPTGWLVGAIIGTMVVILVLGLIGGSFDRMLASRELREARRLSALANAAVEGIVICRDGRIEDANQTFSMLIGLPVDDLRGTLLAGHMTESSQYAIVNALNKSVSSVAAAELRTATGHSVPVELVRQVSDGEESGRVILAVRDLRERNEAESRMRYLAHHDSLTGLANRSFFGLRLEDAMAKAKRTDAQLAFHYIDLDRFKDANDLQGHIAGDAILKETARRLEELAGPGDIVARLGGDEFAVVQVELVDASSALRFAESICACLGNQFVIPGKNPITVTASVGIAIFPSDGRGAESLTHSADVALYRAKDEGRATYRVFEKDMAAQLLDRKLLQQALQRALSAGELSVAYQPQVRISDGSILGFEALARWRHPERGMIPPATFIPLAEESGAIVPIGEWILRTACEEASRWSRPLSISVNLSPVQITQGDLPQLVQTIIIETGLAPARLELEVTESVLIRDIDRTLHILRRLKAIGVRIAMDDFGTGYSSLSYLQSFPFDKIKIDRSFIQNIDSNAHSRAIVRAVVGLGHALHLPVVAEGVETKAQMDVLRIESCEEVQGYLTGRPLAVESLAELLAADEPESTWAAAKTAL